MKNLKICVLDTNTVTKGDVSLAPLEQFGEVTYHDMLPPDEVIKAIGHSEVVICNKTHITAEIIAACPNLKFITLFATGYNNIDIVAAAKRGIVVSNTPDYSTDSVAQHTFALILELAENLSKYSASVMRGDWVKSKKFCYFSYPFRELAGKTLGIIGFGTIGRAVAKIAQSFNMRVVANARTPKTAEGVEFLSREEVIRQADFLTLHCPLNEGTKGLINRETLALMKPTAYLINTARGGVVEEEPLCEALHNGTIAGAAIDVLDQEPMRNEHPYLKAPNIIITPHVAWAAVESRTRLIGRVADNIAAFQKGEPINVVNNL